VNKNIKPFNEFLAGLVNDSLKGKTLPRVK